MLIMGEKLCIGTRSRLWQLSRVHAVMRAGWRGFGKDHLGAESDGSGPSWARLRRAGGADASNEWRRTNPDSESGWRELHGRYRIANGRWQIGRPSAPPSPSLWRAGRPSPV